MQEWTDPYNSFNSFKVLLWREQLEGCITGDLLPPIIVDTDPAGICNLNCIWCNAYDFMKKNPLLIPEDHLLKLADFYSYWGVKGTCIAGGGEPLMNPGINNFLLRLQKNNVEAAIISNGTLQKGDHFNIAADTCRWYGFSMDAGTPETWLKVKGVKNEKLWYKVLKNIESLTDAVHKRNSKCDVGYKFLLHPDNAYDILPAVKLAKSLGVKDFQLRPVGWDNIEKTKGKAPISFTDLFPVINQQIEEALKYEDENFRFFGIRHKFSPTMKRKVNFKKCRAISLSSTFSADGKVHLCFDMRGNEDLIMCSHYPDPYKVLNYWGSTKHLAMIDSIDPNKCPRCTYGAYNEMIEQCIIEDGFCRNFP